MKILIIQKYDLREKNRLLMAFLTLTALVHLQKRNITHLLELTCTKSECHSNKRIVTTGRTYRIQLVLDSLPSLIKISPDFVQRVLDSSLFSAGPVLVGVFHKFADVFVITLLCVWSEDLVDLRHCKATVLLCCCTQDDITHDIKCSIQCLRLVVPDIPHLETAA